MKRLAVVVEGQTEAGFVNQVLAPHLLQFDLSAWPASVPTSRDNSRGTISKGGGRFSKFQAELVRQLNACKQRSDRAVTTMIDLYRLDSDFPGRVEAQAQQDPQERVKFLEACWAAEIGDRRFIPYIQLHEFGSLVLAGPEEFKSIFLEPRHERPIANLIEMASQFDNPEKINEGEATHPAMRIKREIKGYDKVAHGPAIAQRIGLPRLRQRCPHFNDWVGRLEGLSTAPLQTDS